MGKIRNIIKAIFISPEMLVGLLVFLCYLFLPHPLALLGHKLKSSSDAWKYFPSLTLIFSAAAFRFSTKIRAPSTPEINRALFEYPLYKLIVGRVMVGLGFAIVCGITAVSIWAFGQMLSDTQDGGIISATTGISATTSFTMLLAYQKVRELAERFG